jgi:hypothetical protein
MENNDPATIAISNVQPTIKGVPVSLEQLKEIEKDGSKKLVEKSPGEFSVLERMRG